MTDRAGLFAAYADLLTEMCACYILIGLLFMGERGWSLPLGWILLVTTACAVFFRLLLRRPRGAPLLTAVTVLLIAAVTFVFWRLSGSPKSFGLLLALALGAGLAAGLSLYHCLRRPTILQHLSHLDGLILALIILFLFEETGRTLRGDAAFMIAALLLDAAACVGLRMSDGDGADSGDAVRASLLALGAALLLALLILLAMAVFSRSGSVTGAVLHGIGAALSALWAAVERFFFWFASLFDPPETDYAAVTAVAVSAEMPEPSQIRTELSVNTTAVLIVLCLLVLAAAVFTAWKLRHSKAAAAAGKSPSAAGVRVRRSGGALGRLWERFRAAVRFRWTAFVHRDTPGGVLVWLERRSRRARNPRGAGESMRAFLRRLDPDGGLEELADALDREYYGGAARTMSPRRCRELRRFGRGLFRNTASA